MSSTPDSSTQTLSKKKSLIITLANARDLPGLLELMKNETHEELVIQIIEAIGALGQQKALPELKQLANATENDKIKASAQKAIEVIRHIFNY